MARTVSGAPYNPLISRTVIGATYNRGGHPQSCERAGDSLHSRRAIRQPPHPRLVIALTQIHPTVIGLHYIFAILPTES